MMLSFQAEPPSLFLHKRKIQVNPVEAARDAHLKPWRDLGPGDIENPGSLRKFIRIDREEKLIPASF